MPGDLARPNRDQDREQPGSAPTDPQNRAAGRSTRQTNARTFSRCAVSAADFVSAKSPVEDLEDCVRRSEEADVGSIERAPVSNAPHSVRCWVGYGPE